MEPLTVCTSSRCHRRCGVDFRSGVRRDSKEARENIEDAEVFEIQPEKLGELPIKLSIRGIVNQIGGTDGSKGFSDDGRG